MKKFTFGNVVGSKLSGLLKMNFFKVFFKNFDRKFQGTYFPEYFSVAASVAYFVLLLLTRRFLKCFSQFKFFLGLLETSKTFRVKIFGFCLLIFEG